MKSSELLAVKKALLEVRKLTNLKKINDAEQKLNLISKKYSELPDVIFESGSLKMAKGCIEEARKIFIELIGTYMEEYAILKLGYLESSFGSIKKSREYYNMLRGTFQEFNALLELIYLDIKEEKYDSAYEKVNCDKIKCLYPELYIFIANELKLLSYDERISANTYLEKQMLNYSETEALKHILTHKNGVDYKSRHSIFDSSIDLERFFFLVKDHLKKENIIRTTSVDRHILHYDGIGIDPNGNTADYAMVLAIPNYRKIIAIYPYDLNSDYLQNVSSDGGIICSEVYKVAAMSRLN